MSRVLALAAGLAIGLAVLAPARLLLPAPPLAAAAVSGSVWRAQLADAALGSARLGDLALTVQPARLANGELAWALSGQITGVLWRRFDGGGVRQLDGRITGPPLVGLPIAAVSLRGISGDLDGQGRCQSAAGQADVQLATTLAGQAMVSGALRCDAGTLRLPLASPDGRVQLDVTITAAGWRAQLQLAGAGPAEAAALAAAGWRATADRLQQDREGRW